MSKSLGNFITIREALADHHPEVLRYFMIAGHYRSPINYSQDNINKIYQSLATLYRAIREFKELATDFSSDYTAQFTQMMNDDFNTPEALAVLFSLAHEINRLKEKGDLAKAAQYAAELKSLGKVFGILQDHPEHFLQGDIKKVDTNYINDLINQRNAARQQKNWTTADQIRDQLTELGVLIEDTAEGTTWRRV